MGWFRLDGTSEGVSLSLDPGGSGSYPFGSWKTPRMERDCTASVGNFFQGLTILMRKNITQSKPLLLQLIYIVSHLPTVSHCEDPGLPSYGLLWMLGDCCLGHSNPSAPGWTSPSPSCHGSPALNLIPSIDVLPCTGWPKLGTVL